MLQVQRHGATLHNIRHWARLWFRRALQHSREPETFGAALCPELLRGAQWVPNHHLGLSRVCVICGARAAAIPAEAIAYLHSEPIAICATTPRESARHATYVILACWLASRSGSNRVRVRSRRRESCCYKHHSSTRSANPIASRMPSLTSSNMFRCETECSFVREYFPKPRTIIMHIVRGNNISRESTS